MASNERPGRPELRQTESEARLAAALAAVHRGVEELRMLVLRERLRDLERRVTALEKRRA